MSTQEGEQFARDNGLVFMETSAKTSHNVEEVGGLPCSPFHLLPKHKSRPPLPHFLQQGRAPWKDILHCRVHAVCAGIH